MIKLSKSFFQIVYAVKKAEIEVELDLYYWTDESDVYDQFWAFCDWQDELVGVNGLTLHTTMELIYSGHQIIARDDQQTFSVLGFPEK
jgi:hypothetical protein